MSPSGDTDEEDTELSEQKVAAMERNTLDRLQKKSAAGLKEVEDKVRKDYHIPQSERVQIQDSGPALSREAIQRAEIELAGMFSGVISAVMSNVVRERPSLLGGTCAYRHTDVHNTLWTLHPRRYDYYK